QALASCDWAVLEKRMGVSCAYIDDATRRPAGRAPWVVQQLREAFPFDEAGGNSKYLVFDRDTIFSAAVVAAIESMGLQARRTSYQSPWQNGVAERFVGTVRRDLLDHAIVLDDEHLRRLLSEYLAYYHQDRTHLGVEKDAPVARPVDLRPGGAAVQARRRVGGLYHRYEWAAAA
ncbi:MAG TPA: integrase core domain-containing protein, partial [Anaeromyxobacteraceae bacterium]